MLGPNERTCLHLESCALFFQAQAKNVKRTAEDYNKWIEVPCLEVKNLCSENVKPPLFVSLILRNVILYLFFHTMTLSSSKGGPKVKTHAKDQSNGHTSLWNSNTKMEVYQFGVSGLLSWSMVYIWSILLLKAKQLYIFHRIFLSKFISFSYCIQDNLKKLIGNHIEWIIS